MWLLFLLPAPLLGYALSHRWEEREDLGDVLAWPIGALPLLVTMIAARTGSWWRALAAGAGCAALSVATWVWAVPVPRAPVWQPWMLAVVAGCLLGAMAGHRRRHVRRIPRGLVVVAGVLLAFVGGLLAPVTVLLAAEAATSSPGYGGDWFDAGVAHSFTETVPGERALFAVGFPPDRVDCTVTGAGATRAVHALPIRPGSYGDGDFASFDWIGTFDVPAAGDYTLLCHTPAEGTRWAETFTLGVPPRIGGLAGSAVHWPVAVIGLLGACPGLLVLAGRPYPLRPRRRGIERQV